MEEGLLNEVCGILEGSIMYANTGCWVILYKGKMVRVRGGKSSWKELRYAKSALTNYLRNYINYPRSKQTDLQCLIDNGIIEFKNLV